MVNFYNIASTSHLEVSAKKIIQRGGLEESLLWEDFSRGKNMQDEAS